MFNKYDALWLLQIAILLLSSSLAWADDCDSINENEVWEQNFSLMQEAVKNKNDQDAFKHFKTLKQICPRSPALNYLIGLTYIHSEQKSKALEYIILATRNTAEFEVEQEFTRKIWTLRYELENPEHSLDNIEKNKKQLDMMINDNNRLQNENAILRQNDIHHASVVMWTGVGLGISGLVLTGAGGLVLSLIDEPLSEKSSLFQKKNQIYQKYEISGKYIAAWTILGAGIAATITGIVMTSIGATQFVHANHNDFALELGMNGAILHGTF